MATPEQTLEQVFHSGRVEAATSMDEAYYEVLAAKEYSGFLQSQKQAGLPQTPLAKKSTFNGSKVNLNKGWEDSVIGRLSAQRGRKRLFTELKVRHPQL